MNIKAWLPMEEIEEPAKQQLQNVASLDILAGHLAVMPDVHFGIGATVGSVIPTFKAIIPAAVGVDIGCGMEAVQTNLKAHDIMDNLRPIRNEIERRIPLGAGGRHSTSSSPLQEKLGFPPILDPIFQKLDANLKKAHTQCGTLGSGNHFIEICLDEKLNVWVMLHSGSRGIGNMIAQHFITLAKEDMLRQGIALPDVDLAYFTDDTQNFTEYTLAVDWAQRYAALNRHLMLKMTLRSIKKFAPTLEVTDQNAISCHHNYVEYENHFSKDMWITRKGAINADKGKLGIIPGSMGTKSYIVRGLGNPESYNSASHGAGRRMSRGQARRTFTNEDLILQTQGVECRKDNAVLDEIPGAYKDIDKVMFNQRDLVEVVHTLKQIMCVKGG